MVLHKLPTGVFMQLLDQFCPPLSFLIPWMCSTYAGNFHHSSYKLWVLQLWEKWGKCKHLQWLSMTKLFSWKGNSSPLVADSWTSYPLVGCTIWSTVQLYVRFIPFWMCRTGSATASGCTSWQLESTPAHHQGNPWGWPQTTCCGKQQGFLSQCVRHYEPDMRAIRSSAFTGVHQSCSKEMDLQVWFRWEPSSQTTKNHDV